MTLDECRVFYADEIRIAAGLDLPELVAAYAHVPREKFMGPPPWQITSPDAVSMTLRGLRHPCELCWNLFVHERP
jgi:hypothetical protein